MALPVRLPWELAQSQWASQLNPVLSLPLLQGQLLQNVMLKSGNNNVNTMLSKMQQGWILVDQSAAATIYRSKPFNSTTLTLNSSAPCVVSLWVF